MRRPEDWDDEVWSDIPGREASAGRSSPATDPPHGRRGLGAAFPALGQEACERLARLLIILGGR